MTDERECVEFWRNEVDCLAMSQLTENYSADIDRWWAKQEFQPRVYVSTMKITAKYSEKENKWEIEK